MIKYLVVHDWNFSNGSCGHYENTFYDFDFALEQFTLLRLLIETDDYDFPVIIPDFKEGDLSYSVYEEINSSMNRQDLVLKKVDVSL